MPFITVNDVKLHYTDEGQGDETIVFSHGLLFSGKMFEAQVAHFRDRYRVITYDHRGQGKTEVAKDGYDMDTLASDAVALIEALDIGPVHFAGLSMGGFVGMRLAARQPHLLRSLTLLDTSADPEPVENRGSYRKMNFVARWFGLRMVIDKIMPILFGQTFLNDPMRTDQKSRWRNEIIHNDRIGITRAVTGVITRNGVIDEIGSITTPTLVMVGEEDVATVPEKAARIHERIKGSRLVHIPRAGHSSSIEEPDFVNAEMEKLLQQAGG